MHTSADVSNVARLVAQGLSDLEIARRTSIPRRTVSDWRRGRAPNKAPGCVVCRGDLACIPSEQYAYALGLYLGDGCISDAGRTFRIRFALDAAYPSIVAACAATLETLVPGKRAWSRQRPSSRCVDVAMYWNHWPCLFPQHGPGRKHERRIALTDWQRSVLVGEQQALVCGLFDSDGCRIVANDRGRASVRYHFSNESDDIKAILCSALDELGVKWTRPCGKQIAVYRRASVARLETFIGPKC